MDFIKIDYRAGENIVASLKQQIWALRNKATTKPSIFRKSPGYTSKDQALLKQDEELIAYLEPLIKRPYVINVAEKAYQISVNNKNPAPIIHNQLSKFLRQHPNLMSQLHFIDGISYRRLWEAKARVAYQKHNWTELNKISTNLSMVKEIASHYKYEVDVLYFVGGYHTQSAQVSNTKSDYLSLDAISKTLSALVKHLKAN